MNQLTSTANVLDVVFVFLSKKLLIYRSMISNIIGFKMEKFHSSLIFFLWSFLAYTDDLQCSRVKEEIIFIPLYHFHPHKNVQIFICSFPFEMDTFRY